MLIAKTVSNNPSFLVVCPFIYVKPYSSISQMAAHVIEQMNAMVSVLTVIAYTAGVVLTISGIMQFKTHKDNPQQTPLSKPVVLVIVAACLLFLPSVIGTAGVSLFGERAVSAAKGI